MNEMINSEGDKFFISYNKEDISWAEWIAWVLEEAEYEVFFQKWDIKPGNNFIIEMQNAATSHNRTIAVLSDHYVVSKFTQPEWASAFSQDPTGEKKILVPVKIENMNLEGMFRSIVYIDLVGLDDEEAKRALLTGVSKERAKPLTKPIFPGKQEAIVKYEAKFPVDKIEEDALKNFTVISFLTVEIDSSIGITSSIRNQSSRLVIQQTNIHEKELIESLLATYSKIIQEDDELTFFRTLYELIVPDNLKEILSRENNFSLVVDGGSAIIPWEGIIAFSYSLFNIPIQDISKIIRQVSTSIYRANNIYESQSTALVIDASNNTGNTQNLKSKGEVVFISEMLKSAGFKVESLINPSSGQIIESLFSEDYQIIHIEGIGINSTDKTKGSGIVIGPNLILSSKEFRQMSLMPKFVFINFGLYKIVVPDKENGEKEENDLLFSQLAASFATCLIENGVESVVISALPVNEMISYTFSKTLYQALLDGNTFSNAVSMAKQNIFYKEPKISTLITFQCYGNMNYKLTNKKLNL
jgi:hypothetical protein